MFDAATFGALVAIAFVLATAVAAFADSRRITSRQPVIAVARMRQRHTH